MKSTRCYYSSSFSEFIMNDEDKIYGEINRNSVYDISLLQANAWRYEISFLKDVLKEFSEGRIIFEYTIPRMGKHIDVILLYNNIMFLLEFKCGEKFFHNKDIEQVYDYALDLQNFHKESYNKLLVPILIATEAHSIKSSINIKNMIIEPIACNKETLLLIINDICNKYKQNIFDYKKWENSEYLPTPTIIEAAQALYQGHNVEDITRNEAGAENLSVTCKKVNEIIEYSKLNRKKSICFVTGVPGAGKTLVGLNLAIERSIIQDNEHAVFLSGNLPLVTVLQHALARDKVLQAKNTNNKVTKKDTLRQTSAFIQIIHKYRDAYINNNAIPPEHIVIFDEAQRVWTKEQISKFMKTKKGIEDFSFSEPEFLISTMDRHSDWAVIVCLVGGGQEINTGEAGLPEWLFSLKRSFQSWDVYVAPELNDTEYTRNKNWKNLIEGLNVEEYAELHLKTSIRSFRTSDLANFIKLLLDNDIAQASNLFCKIKEMYPIFFNKGFAKSKAMGKRKKPGLNTIWFIGK